MTENSSENKQNSLKASESIYKNIYSSYSHANLTEESQSHISAVIQNFFKNADIGKDDFLAAAPILFKMQPSAGDMDIPSARKEVLRIGEELLNDTIFDNILNEECKEKQNIFLNENYFILYHYLSRYWAIREKADAAKSPVRELAICYRNICISARIIYLLEGKSLEEADAFVARLAPLKPKIPNRFKSFLDKDEELEDSDYGVQLLRRGNAIRLCWLWDRIVIELYILIAHDLLLPITMVASQVSWALYLFLASVHITGVLGAYFDALAQQKRLEIEAKRVLRAHLKLRRDVIVNDLVWGFANLACCFWLCGLGLYGNIGDLLTGLLLVMDLSMVIWRYSDDKKEHFNDIDGYNNQLRALIKKASENINDDRSNSELIELLKNLNKAINDNDYKLAKLHLANLEKNINGIQDKKLKENLQIIYWQLKSLNSSKESCHDIWEEKKLFMRLDIIYAASLIVAFSAFCIFYLSFFHITLPLTIVLFGALSLAGATLIWRSTNSFFETKNISKGRGDAEKEYNALINKFINEQNNLTEKQQIQLYLKILQKGAKVGYQEDKLLYKKLEVLRETANRIFIPGAIVMTFLFLPVSVVGVPTFVFLLLGVLAATIISSIYIKKYYKPKDTKWVDEKGNLKSQPCFIESQFNEFKEIIKNTDFSEKDKREKILEIIKESRVGKNAQLFTTSSVFKKPKDNTNNDNNDSEEAPLLGGMGNN